MTLPAQPPARAGGARRAVAGVLGSGAAVTALTVAGAPWWVVAIIAVAAIAAPAALGLAQILMPEESSDKRELLVELLHHRERRALVRQPQRRSVNGRE